MTHLRRRFWVETGLAGAGALLLVVTVIWRDWLEIVYGVDPDGGSGAMEWLIVVIAAAGSTLFSALARVEWRRWRTAEA